MFDQAQREIFPYFNGERQVMGDPLAIDRRLRHFLPQSAIVVLQKWDEAEKALAENPETTVMMPDEGVRFEAEEQLLDAVAKAFRMLPYNDETGQGAQETHLRKCWEDYCAFMDEKKNPTVTSPTTFNSGDGTQPSSFMDPLSQPSVIMPGSG